ncbi:hypothetical protein F5Y18DRAFT_376792 [Xylariaceae sp. FL1019]|nr:hypothetical protein F5Y18DRAFT_376792 [Xylariaceae sp. FL1019]
MEESAPKRRKTSPTSSINLPAGTSQPNSDTSGSSDSGGKRRSTRLNRPSFLSPTKASLARSNPDVLARRNSRRSSSPSKQQLPAASDPGSPGSDHGSESGLVTAQLEAESETGRLQDLGASDSQNAAAGRAVSPVRRAGGGLAMQPKRTPSKGVPSPRPLPPPSAEEEELIDPFKRRGRLRRSPPPGVFPVIEPEEPELPPTPTQQGLSDPTSMISSPLGMNTPSKRPRRSKVLAERMKSSPLKQSPMRPPALERSADNENEGEAGIDVFAPIPLTLDPLRNEPKRKKKKRKSHPGRKIQEEPDPLADKKALRDSLLAEVEKLQADRGVAEHENERLFSLQYPGRSASKLPETEQQQSLVNVLGRHALPAEEEAPPDPAQAWLDAAMDPLNSLPFGKGNVISLPSLFTPNAEPSEELPPPTSHHPIPMTAEEELPHLQVFSPLVYTSTIANIPRESTDESEPIHQRHSISASSSPPGLFSASIEMVVNTKTLSIAELSVPRLDPNAAGELKPFIDTITQGNVNNSLKRNLNVLTWSMGEWLRIATKRAKFWHVVQSELGSEEGLRECARSMRRHNRRRRKQDDEDEENGDKSKKMSKGDMLELMGRTTFDLDLSGFGGDEDEGLTARVQWRVKFDWTGEARSEIGLLMGVPAKWHAGDGKGSLTGIPSMFDKLLRESGDPMEALRTVAALIVGEDSS